MPKIIALVPAAGVGSRFGAQAPKQYVSVLGQPVLFHTLNVLNQSAKIDQLAVVLAPEDEYFDQFQWPFFKMLKIRAGGESRAQTVINGITVLLNQGLMQPDDWVLVHDAARCCLNLPLLNQFIDTIKEHSVGGLLALPVADTLKQADQEQHVQQTISRNGLWQAQTPQMFRAELLLEALTEADLNTVTDEASAIEQMGLSALLVEGMLSNFKLTFSHDLPLVEAILTARKKG
ncbi:2-C-methyl-D-erythritol 4-phosphate cytidylyltransferase [Neisseria sp. Ec49-e6-T10]|uniref:2-C-methyl-D-erythritol 4-phosphate cytidylyltransferase n=1 Tax=Neisseria sp. Ec49-e6-T10 TaxID=3140744 RepID=UPI003EBD06BF